MNFIKNPNEERAMLEDKYPFKEAYEELERLSKDPANKWAYESAYRAIKDEESRIKDASLVAEAKGLAKGLAEGKAEGLTEGVLKGKAEGLAEGKAEGLAEGVLKGKAETEMTMIKKMHANGLSIEQIAQFTAMHQSDILQILNS
jgi:flagellar biosynthesis/type III secretory pathway protein FliH